MTTGASGGMVLGELDWHCALFVRLPLWGRTESTGRLEVDAACRGCEEASLNTSQKTTANTQLALAA